MHPFGGTPVCPRCAKVVYAAEQVMGPGRKLYHKPCLACTSCGKRLDSFTLLEHDQQPYCKPCHTRSFGTRDLRQANLPHREDPSPITSDDSGNGAHLHTRSLSPVRAQSTPIPAPTYIRTNTISPPPTMTTAAILKPNRTLQNHSQGSTPPPDTQEEAEEGDDKVSVLRSRPRPISTSFVSGLTNTGRSSAGLPRTVPLSPTPRVAAEVYDPSVQLTRSNTTPVVSSRSEADLVAKPLAQASTGTPTGTRYGAMLSGNGTGSGTLSPARKWGGTVPNCPKCGKSVYFAEQVKAVGKTWHKACLRCTECGTSLDSTRLTEKDGSPLCHRCYGKLHGPQGSGYALLGKAGG